MAVNLVSPGVKIREIDLTIGRIDLENSQIGAFAGPFSKGPVELPILIRNEQELTSVFGKPSVDSTESEYWLSASNYLSYGGTLRVVRVFNNTMGNAYSPVGVGSTADVKVKSVEDYINLSSSLTGSGTIQKFEYAAKNPGAWANKIKVFTIDAAADQIISGINTGTFSFVAGSVTNRSGTIVGLANTIGITTTNISLGDVVNCDISGVISTGTTVTGISNGVITISSSSLQTENVNTTFDFGSIQSTGAIQVGHGVSVAKQNIAYAGIGTTTMSFNGYLKGIVTGVGSSSINVKFISRHTETTAEIIDYSPGNPLTSIASTEGIKIINNSDVAIATITTYNVTDWYNEQTLKLSEQTTVYWRNLAERPSTSEYVRKSGGKNDEFNVVIVDAEGKINGNVGEILESFSKLSKASDGKISPAQPTFYVDYLRDNSNYIFAGKVSEGVNSRFSTLVGYSSYSSGLWATPALNNFFKVSGNKEYTLDFGRDSTQGETLQDIVNAYQIFENPAEYSVDYIISGPYGELDNRIYEAQTKANTLISIAENRKDCIAVISPTKTGIVQQTNSTTQTNNIINFFSGVSPSTYAVFDCGHKYTYDRFNNRFLYLACNSDIAGLMARTAINQYPWYSPAGASRGALNNAIKLAYNPSEAQRDLLYTNKINPIIASPGQGIILFGDKTASAYQSAFDRINVRKLFLTIEKTIELSARSQLFEFNDPITRSNFVNIVEPYLRDVRAKRGITEYLLVCDESNNTPDVIDSNQFVADIYVKPARSINFITLTFVATRTGVSFVEVVQNA